MSQYHPPATTPTTLSNKIIVLTGGSLGIGAALTRLLHAQGAHVYYGDILTAPGEELQTSLQNPTPSTSVTSTGSATFIGTDVTNYADTVRLFDRAFRDHGRVDHAVCNAGMGERGNLIDAGLTLETVRREPKETLKSAEVNFTAPLHFARVASVYLRQGEGGCGSEADSSSTRNKSLTFVSSVAGLIESPGLYVYAPAKTGVLGLMRAIWRPLSAEPYCVRANAICPWMVRTRLTAGIEEEWDKAGLPANTPEDVAGMIVGVMVDGEIVGESVYVEGGRGWKIEEGLRRLQPQWFGGKQSQDMDRGQILLASDKGWKIPK